MLHKYEALILTVPEITQDETKNLELELDRMIQGAKGSTISFERWGKYKLAYSVRKNDYGVYFLMRFEVPENTSIIQDIQTFFKVKLHDIVMREMVSVLDEQPLAYQRPKSLEESPTSRDVNAFLKEHKMEGLLSSVGPKGKDPQAVKPVEKKEDEAPAQEAERPAE